eukprot:COSAG02_NODE_2255_length_9345_cov_3.269414_4_plen_189_part_00
MVGLLNDLGGRYDDSDPFGVDDDQDQDGSEIQLGSTGAVVPNKPTELSVSDNSMDIVWTMSGDLPDGGPDVLRFELSYGKSLAPVATWRLVPCTHRTDGYGDLMEYSTTLGGLTAGTTLAVRLRVIYGVCDYLQVTCLHLAPAFAVCSLTLRWVDWRQMAKHRSGRKRATQFSLQVKKSASRALPVKS